MKFSQRGFTIVEIMFVVLVIGILVAIAIPSFAKVQRRSLANEMLSDARTLQNALVMYRDEVADTSAYSSASNNWARIILISGDRRWPTAPTSEAVLNPGNSDWDIIAPTSVSGDVTVTDGSTSVSVNRIRKLKDIPGF